MIVMDSASQLSVYLNSGGARQANQGHHDLQAATRGLCLNRLLRLYDWAHRCEVPPHLADEHLPAWCHDHVLIAWLRRPPAHLRLLPYCVLDRDEDDTNPILLHLDGRSHGPPPVSSPSISDKDDDLGALFHPAHVEQHVCVQQSPSCVCCAPRPLHSLHFTKKRSLVMSDL